jgi:DNA polymerase sigma
MEHRFCLLRRRIVPNYVCVLIIGHLTSKLYLIGILYHGLMSYSCVCKVLESLVNLIYVMVIIRYLCSKEMNTKQLFVHVMGSSNLL